MRRVLKRDARCGTACRRAQALLANSPDAAVWDLQRRRASRQSKPVGKLLKKARAQAKATASRLAVGRRGAAGGEMPDYSKMMSMGGGARARPTSRRSWEELGGGAGGAPAQLLAGLGARWEEAGRGADGAGRPPTCSARRFSRAKCRSKAKC